MKLTWDASGRTEASCWAHCELHRVRYCPCSTVDDVTSVTLQLSPRRIQDHDGLPPSTGLLMSGHRQDTDVRRRIAECRASQLVTELIDVTARSEREIDHRV